MSTPSSDLLPDPPDPRAPPQEVWDRLTDEERERVVASLPFSIPRALPPEGDAHANARAKALEALRWASHVLDLDLMVEGDRIRFFHGTAPLLDSRELIRRLSTMVDDAIRRAEDEARRAEDEARRAERLAAKLRALGVDPDDTD